MTHHQPRAMHPMTKFRSVLGGHHLIAFRACLETTSSRSKHACRLIRPLVQKSSIRPASSTIAVSSGNGAGDATAHFTVTTPLYYVNAAPHMGSAYPTIAADVLGRYYRLSGQKVNFITGTDEHGEKIALAAGKRGMNPKEHCDDVVASYLELWKALDISYDSFVRTTDSKHEALVTTILERVWTGGDIYKANYKGWYCIDCEEYKDEGDMDAERNCPVHRRPCVEREEENYFFKLSKYQDPLERLLQERNDFVMPEARRNEVLGWVKEGLRDFSISRSAVAWGIPIQRDPSQTIYVWFDALNGYLSGLYKENECEQAGIADSNELSTKGWPASVHIIGKDILRFHAVYWPAMLMSAGLPLPKQVFGHGFLTKDGLKMGKSLGNVLEPTALVNTYGSDAVRFYFMKEISFGQDGDFSEERFRNIVNASLANDIGNLLNRTLTLLRKNCEGKLPIAASEIPESDPLRQCARDSIPLAVTGYQRMRFHDACNAVLSISGRGNQYLEEMAPWTAFKKGDDGAKAQAAATLVAVLEAVRIVAVALSPVTPSLSVRIYRQLGLVGGMEGDQDGRGPFCDWDEATAWGLLERGHQTAPPSPVFTRLEGDWITETSISKDTTIITN